MLGLRLVMGNCGLEMRQKINGGALRDTYIHTYNSDAVKLNSERKVQGKIRFNPKEFIRISVL